MILFSVVIDCVHLYATERVYVSLKLRGHCIAHHLTRPWRVEYQRQLRHSSFRFAHSLSLSLARSLSLPRSLTLSLHTLYTNDKHRWVNILFVLTLVVFLAKSVKCYRTCKNGQFVCYCVDVVVVVILVGILFLFANFFNLFVANILRVMKFNIENCFYYWSVLLATPGSFASFGECVLLVYGFCIFKLLKSPTVVLLLVMCVVKLNWPKELIYSQSWLV